MQATPNIQSSVNKGVRFASAMCHIQRIYLSTSNLVSHSPSESDTHADCSSNLQVTEEYRVGIAFKACCTATATKFVM